MKYLMVSVVFFTQLSARDPFNFEMEESESNLLVTANFIDMHKHIYFNENSDKIQITLQEKSPSTLEKAEGLGG